MLVEGPHKRTNYYYNEASEQCTQEAMRERERDWSLQRLTFCNFSPTLAASFFEAVSSTCPTRTDDVSRWHFNGQCDKSPHSRLLTGATTKTSNMLNDKLLRLERVITAGTLTLSKYSKKKVNTSSDLMLWVYLIRKKLWGLKSMNRHIYFLKGKVWIFLTGVVWGT